MVSTLLTVQRDTLRAMIEKIEAPGQAFYAIHASFQALGYLFGMAVYLDLTTAEQDDWAKQIFEAHHRALQHDDYHPFGRPARALQEVLE